MKKIYYFFYTTIFFCLSCQEKELEYIEIETITNSSALRNEIAWAAVGFVGRKESETARGISLYTTKTYKLDKDTVISYLDGINFTGIPYQKGYYPLRKRDTKRQDTFRTVRLSYSTIEGDAGCSFYELENEDGDNYIRIDSVGLNKELEGVFKFKVVMDSSSRAYFNGCETSGLGSPLIVEFKEGKFKVK